MLPTLNWSSMLLWSQANNPAVCSCPHHSAWSFTSTTTIANVLKPQIGSAINGHRLSAAWGLFVSVCFLILTLIQSFRVSQSMAITNMKRTTLPQHQSHRKCSEGVDCAEPLLEQPAEALQEPQVRALVCCGCTSQLNCFTGTTACESVHNNNNRTRK